MWSQSSFRLQATSPQKKTAAEKVPMHPKSVEETLAEDIAEEVRRHGGQLQANHLPSLRPDVRKRLGDEKLLHFLGRFSDLVQIQEKHGGHVLLAEAPRVECSNVIGNAKAAATCPGPSIPERAVHALRQLEREVLRCVHDTSRSVDIAYLLHNGKLRRKIGAVVRFLPLADLMIQETDGESLEACKRLPQICTCSNLYRLFVTISSRPTREVSSGAKWTHLGLKGFQICYSCYTCYVNSYGRRCNIWMHLAERTCMIFMS